MYSKIYGQWASWNEKAIKEHSLPTQDEYINASSWWQTLDYDYVILLTTKIIISSQHRHIYAKLLFWIKNSLACSAGWNEKYWTVKNPKIKG